MELTLPGLAYKMTSGDPYTLGPLKLEQKATELAKSLIPLGLGKFGKMANNAGDLFKFYSETFKTAQKLENITSATGKAFNMASTGLEIGIATNDVYNGLGSMFKDPSASRSDSATNFNPSQNYTLGLDYSGLSVTDDP